MILACIYHREGYLLIIRYRKPARLLRGITFAIVIMKDRHLNNFAKGYTSLGMSEMKSKNTRDLLRWE